MSRNYEYNVFGKDEHAFYISRRAKERGSNYGRRAAKFIGNFNRRVNDIVASVNFGQMKESNAIYILDLIYENAIIEDCFDDKDFYHLEMISKNKLNEAKRVILMMKNCVKNPKQDIPNKLRTRLRQNSIEHFKKIVS